MKPKNKKQVRKFLRFSSAGAQMLVTVLAGKYIGEYLDNYYYPDTEVYFYEKWLSLVFVVLAMISLIMQVINISNKD